MPLVPAPQPRHTHAKRLHSKVVVHMAGVEGPYCWSVRMDSMGGGQKTAEVVMCSEGAMGHIGELAGSFRHVPFSVLGRSIGCSGTERDMPGCPRPSLLPRSVPHRTRACPCWVDDDAPLQLPLGVPCAFPFWAHRPPGAGSNGNRKGVLKTRSFSSFDHALEARPFLRLAGQVRVQWCFVWWLLLLLFPPPRDLGGFTGKSSAHTHFSFLAFPGPCLRLRRIWKKTDERNTSSSGIIRCA